ncbi:DNA gyrase C-terminal beta-propeller domain-containing protein, partial [Acinetobacter baumannii]
ADRTIVFATAKGNVRRNALSDFVNVMANGKIAMKFEGEDADDALVGVVQTTEHDDVLLATRQGQCLRFAITDENLRVFRGR